MSDAYPLVPLGDVLAKSAAQVALDPTERYTQVTIRLWGKGVVQRDEVTGAEIAAATRYVVHSGQFILSRIDARNGAFGLVPDILNGAVVSTDFPAFNVSQEQLNPSFLDWMSKTEAFVDLCREASEGTTNRVRLKEDKFLRMRIPLPPLAEQRRIVARIEALAARIAEARGLRRQAAADADNLPVVMAHRPDLDRKAKLREGWHEVTIGDVVRQVQEPVRVSPEGSYPNFGIYSFGRGLFAKPPISGFATSADVLYRVRRGQFIYSRLFAFEGSYGMVTDDFHEHFVSGEYPTFACDTTCVNASFLYAYFKAPHIWTEVATGSKGLGDRRQRVQPGKIIAHRLMLPPIEWQIQIAEMQAKVDAVKRLQAETAAELDALLPSVLDRAFRGAL